MDKFRIVSDLHIDANNGCHGFEKVDDIFTVVAGDIDGCWQVSKKFLTSYIKKGVFVAGNHIVYNFKGKTLNEIKDIFAKDFPIDNTITFLDASTECMSKEVDDILFIGTTLYTDYKYMTKYIEKACASQYIMSTNDVKCNMQLAEHGLNDFYFGRIKTNGKVVNLHPRHYVDMFNMSMEKIKTIVENNPTKNIVIVSHHCPSPSCISKKYSQHPLNASYVSDLDEFIKDHDNIKCWVCGHVHYPINKKIGKCRIVANPLGYINKKENVDWSPDTFIDTTTWKICKKK